MWRLVVLTRVLIFAIVVLAASCGPDPERYVILNTAPFVETQIALPNPSNSAAIKSELDALEQAVRDFSREHGMDFLRARDTLRDGEINVSARGQQLNLIALRQFDLSKDNLITVFAIARTAPTARDKELTSQFIKRIKFEIANPHTT